MKVEPIPFRVRIGVVTLRGIPSSTASEAIGGRILQTLHQEVSRLLDDESARRLRDADVTRLAFRLLTVPEEPQIVDILAASRMPPDVAWGLAPDRPSRTRSARERLLDDCDALLVLTPDAITEEELAEEATVDAALAYARLRNRPLLALPVAGPAAVVVPGSRIDARSISRIDLYNTWPVADAMANRYATNIERDVFEGEDASTRSGGGASTSIPETDRALVREHIIPYYVRASLISAHFQRTYLRTARRVYALAVVAVAFVAVGAIAPAFGAVAFALELAVLVLILLLIRRAHGTRAHEKWLEARFLTERLRHALFLVACGVRPGHHRIPPHVGGREPPDLWMALAFEEICSRLPKLPACDEQKCLLLSDFARSRWVGGQLEYYRGKKQEYERKGTFLERAGLVMFSAAILVASVHLVLLGAHALHLEWPEPPWLEGGLTWLALVLPAAGASIGGFRAHREYSRLAKRSAAMVAALEDVEARLGRVADPPELQAMLGEIEAWMVEENQGWLILLEPLRLEAV